MGGENEGGEILRFTLPSFPVSSNKLYDINHITRNVRLSDQAMLWRTRTIPFVKPCRWPVEWLLKLTLEYQSPQWHYKNGNLRRLDVQNLEKLVIDTLFAKWGWDDSRIVEKTSRKTWGERELIVVTLERGTNELQKPD
jgi:Holliday junction resolvase RusA-like endonuclease